MTALDKNPSQKNILSNHNFKFYIKRSPNINFFVQKVNLPGIKVISAEYNTPFKEIPWPGDHLKFNPLAIEFKLNEDMSDYLEIHNWIRAVSRPDDFDEYKVLADKSIISQEGIKSELLIHVLNSNKKAFMEIVFHDAYPIEMTNIQFDSTVDEVIGVICQVAFDYRSYNINPIL